VMRKSNSESFP